MIPPLTKKDKDGNLYTRPTGILTAIDAAIQQDIAALRRRAPISKVDSPDFIPMECFVHLIRAARRRRDEQTMSTLLPPLLARCEAMLIRKIPDRSRPNAIDIREEILGEFSVLFAEDGSGENPDQLDFFECRFNLAFRSFRIDFMRRRRTDAMQMDESSPENETGDSQPGGESLSYLSTALQTPAMQLSGVFRVELLNAIRCLPPVERRAVVLCHMYEYEIESEDPSKITAATLCGVTGRTIRNRLSRAAEKLSQFNNKEVGK
jgi:hypothetical protein